MNVNFSEFESSNVMEAQIMKTVKVFIGSGAAAIALLFMTGTSPALAQSTAGNNAKANSGKPDVTITVVTNAKQLQDTTRSSISLPAPASETATEAVEGSEQEAPAEESAEAPEAESNEAPEAESNEASETESAEKQDAKESQESAKAAEHEAEDQAKEAESQAKEAESEAKDASQNGADDGSGDGGSSTGSGGGGL